MTKILFVCHGNICRSPMAEYIFKDMVRARDLEAEFEIDSAATSREEIGRDIYPPAKQVMTEHGIAFDKRGARQVTSYDMEHFDHIIIMDENNARNLRRMFASGYDPKICMLMSYAGEDRDVSDPWYTRDFDQAYDDIFRGCKALLEELQPL